MGAIVGAGNVTPKKLLIGGAIYLLARNGGVAKERQQIIGRIQSEVGLWRIVGAVRIQNDVKNFVADHDLNGNTA